LGAATAAEVPTATADILATAVWFCMALLGITLNAPV